MFALIFIWKASTPWFWPALGAGAGVYFFYQGFRLLQRKRLIMNTPSSKIRSAAMGLVEVSGLATGPYTLTAPITGMPCYYYRTMVWEWKHRGKGNSWVKEADESLHVPFYLDDGTARVLVNPQGAELDIHRDFQEEFSHSLFSSSLEIPANITGFLTSHGVDTAAKVKIEEYCIKPKNALFVLGTLADNPGIEVSAVPVRTTRAIERAASFGLSSLLSITETATSSTFQGNATPEVTHSSKTLVLDPTQQAKIADALTKAGITSPAAWAAAGISQTHSTPVPTAVGAAGAAPALALEQFDLHPATVLMKGAHSPAFLISWKSQRDVVRSLEWKSALMIWGGPALTLLCTYILAGEFGWL